MILYYLRTQILWIEMYALNPHKIKICIFKDNSERLGRAVIDIN